MARVREDSGEAKVFCIINQTRNLARLLCVRLDAAAMVAAIDFEEEIEFDAGATCGFVELRREINVVGDEREAINASRKFNGGVELTRLDGNGVGDIAEAMRGEETRLRQSRDCERAVEALCLKARDLGALVRLDVCAQAHAGLPGKFAHARSVVANRSEEHTSELQ